MKKIFRDFNFRLRVFIKRLAYYFVPERTIVMLVFFLCIEYIMYKNYSVDDNSIALYISLFSSILVALFIEFGKNFDYNVRCELELSEYYFRIWDTDRIRSMCNTKKPTLKVFIYLNELIPAVDEIYNKKRDLMLEDEIVPAFVILQTYDTLLDCLSSMVSHIGCFNMSKQTVDNQMSKLEISIMKSDYDKQMKDRMNAILMDSSLAADLLETMPMLISRRKASKEEKNLFESVDNLLGIIDREFLILRKQAERRPIIKIIQETNKNKTDR